MAQQLYVEEVVKPDEEKKRNELPPRMRAAAFVEYGEPSQLKLCDMPTPALVPGAVIVKAHAVGLNPLDWKTLDGALKIPMPFQLPHILGHDMSGVVVQVADDVKAAGHFKWGDDVYGRLRTDSPSSQGTLAEYVVAFVEDIAHKPKNLSHAQASGIPLVALTALECFDYMKVKQGDKVFIGAGAGGVGSFAVQYATKVLGCQVATTCSGAKSALVTGLGAAGKVLTIDYHEQDFTKEIKEYDSALDTVGEALKIFKVLKRGGRCTSISTSPSADTLLKKAEKFDVNIVKRGLLRTVLYFKTRELYNTAEELGIDYEYIFMKPSGKRLADLAKLFENGTLKVVVDKEFKFEEVTQALRHQKKGRATGKVIVNVTDY